MEGERSCYRGGQCREVEWLCYRISQFNGGSMVMLQFKGGRMVMLHFNVREKGDVREVVFNGGSMVMLQRRSV